MQTGACVCFLSYCDETKLISISHVLFLCLVEKDVGCGTLNESGLVAARHVGKCMNGIMPAAKSRKVKIR